MKIKFKKIDTLEKRKYQKKALVSDANKFLICCYSIFMIAFSQCLAGRRYVELQYDGLFTHGYISNRNIYD